jgi:hypothetical protein
MLCVIIKGDATKRCTGCHIIHPITFFGNKKRNSGIRGRGKQNNCWDCRRVERMEWRFRRRGANLLTRKFLDIDGKCKYTLGALRWQEIAGKEMLKIIASRKPGDEIDHIVPLIHPKVCGLNVPANIVPLDATENHKKGNSFDESNGRKTEVKYGRPRATLIF